MIEVKYHEIPGTVNIKHLNRYMLQNVSYYYYQWMSGIVPTLLKIWCWHNTFRGVNKPFKYNTPRVLWEGVG